MAVEWYYRSMGDAIGPLTPKEMRKRALAGEITHDTPVNRSGADDWVTADRVIGLLSPPTDDELRAFASAETLRQESRQSPRQTYVEDFISSSLKNWRALSDRDRRNAIAVAGGLLFVVFVIIGQKPESARTPSVELASSVPREATSDARRILDRDSFYDPDRDPPYLHNQHDGHKSRREAIAALAVQFDAETNWVEANMGSSNSLMVIHVNLVRAKLRDAEVSK